MPKLPKSFSHIVTTEFMKKKKIKHMPKIIEHMF